MIRSEPSRWPRRWRCWSALIIAVAGVARLGFVADLISKPTIIGYMNGLAVTILVGQLPKLFGFSIDGDSFIDDARGASCGAWPTARRSATRSPSGCAGVVIIEVLQRLAGPRCPGSSSPSCCRSPTAALFHLADHGVSLVGTLPKGFPPFTVPRHRARRPRPPRRRCTRHLARLAHRHDLDRVVVRGSSAAKRSTGSGR